MLRHLTAALLAGLVLAAPAAAQEGRPFVPTPVSSDVYAPGPLEPDDLQGPGGATIGLDVARPQPRDGVAPPARVPVVLIMTPYRVLDAASDVAPIQQHLRMVAELTSRGYAVALGHVPGTGRSVGGGCADPNDPNEIEATTRVIEHLASRPWSSGAVGMYGISYDALTQIGVASLGDPQRIRALKAIVPVGGFASEWDPLNQDGVPYGPADNTEYGLQAVLINPGAADPGCRTAALGERARTDLSGDFLPYWGLRDARPHAGRVRAAVLQSQGFDDTSVPVTSLVGWHDRLPASTPRALLLGDWNHAFPDYAYTLDGSPPEARRDTTRFDWLAMVVAWYDRHLKGLPSGTERWPAVQVQDSRRRWRAEREWPRVGRRAGQLGLGAGEALAPAGGTTYREVDGSAAFATGPLEGPLHLAGMPVLDVAVRLTQPDAHLAAELRVVAPDGTDRLLTYAARSARHLDPLTRGYFAQAAGRPAPVGVPVRTALRFWPVDEVVPAGSRLRLVLAGRHEQSIAASGATGQVTVLTGCGTPSVLRFRLPDEDADVLDVQDRSASEVPTGGPAPPFEVDGGGLARREVCGSAPSDPLEAAGFPR
jgi:predicted acyl esterase